MLVDAAGVRAAAVDTTVTAFTTQEIVSIWYLEGLESCQMTLDGFTLLPVSRDGGVYFVFWRVKHVEED